MVDTYPVMPVPVNHMEIWIPTYSMHLTLNINQPIALPLFNQLCDCNSLYLKTRLTVEKLVFLYRGLTYQNRQAAQITLQG